jgi:small ligand-binding sensory domain FIST
MTPFKAVHAAGEDWAHAAQSCSDGLAAVAADANFAFVYVTDLLAEDLASILAYLRQKTGIENWVGSVGIGICAERAEYFDRRAVAVMAGHLPEDSFRVFPAISESTDQLSPETQAWIEVAAPVFGIVHGDPNNPKTPHLIDELAQKNAMFLVGGLTSSRAACHQVAGRLTGGGLSGVLFAPGVGVQTVLSQGCVPVGGNHLISDCLDNVLIGLDGRGALEVFKEDIGELLARDLSRVVGYIHAAIPLPGSDTGDYMVRNLIGIDPDHGWLTIGEPISVGDRVMFVRRDPRTAEYDLKVSLAKLKKRLSGPPRGGVYFSCVARGPGMFGAAGNEMALIQDQLGDIPLVGFFCGGEISNARIYGYTGVLALFT